MSPHSVRYYRVARATNFGGSKAKNRRAIGALLPFRNVAFIIPIVIVLTLLMFPGMAAGQGAFSLVQAPGGITGTLTGTDYINTFGAMNALGFGTPQTGLTVTALSSGAIYFSEYEVEFTGLPTGHNGKFTAYVSTNFNHPAALIVENCGSTGACTTSGGYSAMSTTAAAPSVVVASMGNTTATVGIGIFLPDNDGASAFTGTDNAAVVTYAMTDLTTGHVVASATWTFNQAAPANSVQDAVQLTLGTATGGLTVTPAADYSMNFGNVNGLGIGATVPTVSASGGIVYTTSYYLNPAFTDFTSTTCTLKVYVSTNFAHPTVLQLDNATAAAGPYNAISTNSGSQTQITTTGADRSQITRYLGLFVSLDNTGTPFLGSDSATLTYTVTVP